MHLAREKLQEEEQARLAELKRKHNEEEKRGTKTARRGAGNARPAKNFKKRSRHAWQNLKGNMMKRKEQQIELQKTRSRGRSSREAQT